MSKGDLEGLHFFGRPLKPVAFGLSISMTVLFVVNVTRTGRIDEIWLTSVLALLALVSLVLLVGGWAGNKQKLAEYGLLMTSATLMVRATFLALTIGPSETSVWLTAATAITAAGAFLLESTDLPRPAHARTRATDMEAT